jgi:hypothetical protein
VISDWVNSGACSAAGLQTQTRNQVGSSCDPNTILTQTVTCTPVTVVAPIVEPTVAPTLPTQSTQDSVTVSSLQPAEPTFLSRDILPIPDPIPIENTDVLKPNGNDTNTSEQFSYTGGSTTLVVVGTVAAVVIVAGAATAGPAISITISSIFGFQVFYY